MSAALEPLYYAIVRHFMNGRPDTAEGVIAALASDYGDYKLLTLKDVGEALDTAKENGLLDEVGCDLNDAGELRISYQVSDFGRDMITRYLG